MKKELIELYRQYLQHLDYWNKKVLEEKDRPIPVDDVYRPSFTGFMEWLASHNH